MSERLLSKGHAPAEKLATLKVEGNDALGLGFRIASPVADAEVNLRGVSGTVVGRKFVAYLGFDGNADADKAARALKAFGQHEEIGQRKASTHKLTQCRRSLPALLAG